MRKRKATSILVATLAATGMFAWSGAQAQPMPGFLMPFMQSANLLTLSASANDKVSQDSVVITLFYEQESKDPKALSAALNQHLEAALKKTQGVDGINVSTGQSAQFMSSSSESSRGEHASWRGRVQISLESKNIAAASKLAQTLTPDMQIEDVRFTLSPDARRAAEEKLSRRAIAAFREKAQAAVRALGYRHYTILQISITGEPDQVWMLDGMRREAVASAGNLSAGVPMKAGMSTVTVKVMGTVQMK